MEAITVHKLNEQLVVCLTKLPGFRFMGSCVIRDEGGAKTGTVGVYYSGDFFREIQDEPFQKATREVLKLAKNYAIKTGLGTAATRLNLSATIRENARRLLENA